MRPVKIPKKPSKKPILDHSSKIPLYTQIYDFLIEEIRAGTFKVDERFYSEQDLVRLFKVSPVTARYSLNQLTMKGYIRRKKKSGTFVQRVQVPGLLNSYRDVLLDNILNELMRQFVENGRLTIPFQDLVKKFGFVEGNIRNALLSFMEGNLIRLGEDGLLVVTDPERLFAERMKSNIVSFLAPDINYFHDKVTRPLADILQRDGFFIFNQSFGLSSVNALNIMKAQLPVLKPMGYVVQLITIPEDVSVLEKLERIKVPVVLLDTVVPGSGFDSVLVDNHQIMKLTTNHLIRKGHKNIAFLTYSDAKTRQYEGRSEGYLSTMREKGLVGHFYLRASAKVPPLDFVKQEHITAFVCSNDTEALTIIKNLEDGGIKVPDDVAVTGCDDVDATAGGFDFNAQLTTVSLNPGELAVETARLLKERFVNPEKSPEMVIIKPELIVRGTT